jgi:tripartite-type tricarboxylate transporter receptor subunit TctC
MTTRRQFLQTLPGAVLPAGLAGSWSAHAQGAFPSAPIKIVSGSPPGGSTDAVARLLGDGMAKVLSSPVVIVNTSGAGGNVATEALVHAPADGYTVMVGGNFSHGINPALYKDSKYDPIKDFTPITRIADLPIIIAVTPKSGITSLQDLIAKAKANPGKLNYGSGGSGTPAHLTAEAFKKLAGIDITHVAYRGGGPSAMAALAGEIDVLVDTPPVITPHLPDRKLVALCVAHPSRYAVLPDIPSSKEAGMPQLDVQHWFGLWGPAGIPAAVRDKLFQSAVQVLKTPGAQAALAKQGLMASPSSSTAEFEAFVRTEVPLWKQRTIDSGASAT